MRTNQYNSETRQHRPSGHRAGSDDTDGAVNLWMSVVECTMCAVLVLATMIATELPQKPVERGPEQVIIDATPHELAEQSPQSSAAGGHGLIKATHKLVALEPGTDGSTEIVIELDHALPPDAAVKFLITKTASDTIQP